MISNSIFLGSLYYFSLLDEELLTSANSPRRLLRYTGHVHVRDLALMLEEILYFYRPQGRVLSEQELRGVLSAYDRWVSVEAVPLERDVLAAVTFLLSRGSSSSDSESDDDGDGSHASRASPTERGYFQQHKLVVMMHLGAIAKEMQDAENEARANAPTVDKSPRDLAAGRVSSCWSDIRRIIDVEQERLEGVDNGLMGAAMRTLKDKQKLSVAARMELKRQKTESVHIAHRTVPFNLFSRFVYLTLKGVAKVAVGEEGSPQEITGGVQ